jgi:hypothetical protein
MELLFVTVGGAIFGLGIHYLLPRRGLRGSALLSAIGALVASVSWAGLTWLHWKFDGTWIWVVSLVTAAIIPLVVGLILDRRRQASDDRLLEIMSKA